MDDPFALPPGNVQIAFSGGRSSAMMLHEIVRANGALCQAEEGECVP